MTDRQRGGEGKSKSPPCLSGEGGTDGYEEKGDQGNQIGGQVRGERRDKREIER